MKKKSKQAFPINSKGNSSFVESVFCSMIIESIKEQSWTQKKISWMKLKQVRRIIKISFWFVLFYFHCFIVLNSFGGWKIKISFENCFWKLSQNVFEYVKPFWPFLPLNKFFPDKTKWCEKRNKKRRKFSFSAFFALKNKIFSEIFCVIGLPMPG